MEFAMEVKKFENNNVVRQFGVISEDYYNKAFIERFGEEYKKYRNEWENSSREKTAAFPVHIDIEVNDKCNQACIMCPRNTVTHPEIGYDLGTKSVLGYNLFKEIIDEGVANGVKSILLGQFAEPLIHPEIIKFVKYASEKGIIDIRLITNGLLLHKYGDQLIDSGLTNLFISIDAVDENSYEGIRGKGYNTVVSNVESFIEKRNSSSSYPFPFVRVSFVDMQKNRHEKEAFYEKWSRIVDFVDIQPGDNLAKLPSKNITEEKSFSCVAPWQRMSIKSDGRVLPCCSFYGHHLPIGNLKDQTMQMIWDSNEMSKVRKDIIDEQSPVCETCQHSSLK